MWGYTAVIPVFSALVWLGMLLGMLISWSTSANTRLPSMDQGQTTAYISDVGAFRLKPLFIAGSTIMVVTLDISFVAERWLRHNGKLAPNTSTFQKVLSILSTIFAIAGAAGLILLSIFDTYNHNRVHNGCLLIFMGGYILSAICICTEYQRLGIHYRNHRILRISFWVKLAFILVEVILAIAFASTTFSTRYQNAAGALEWSIAFIFTFYILSFVLDLLPSVQNARHVPQGLQEREKRLEQGGNGTQMHGVNSGHHVGGSYNGNGAGYPPDHSDLGGRKKRRFGRLRW